MDVGHARCALGDVIRVVPVKYSLCQQKKVVFLLVYILVILSGSTVTWIRGQNCLLYVVYIILYLTWIKRRQLYVEETRGVIERYLSRTNKIFL